MKKIQSPNGVAMLLENIWLRHKAGLKQSSQNIFMVELPPVSEEETVEFQSNSFDKPTYTLKDICRIFISKTSS